MTTEQSKDQGEKTKGRSIFGATHENDFLQSFVRIDIGKEEREEKMAGRKRRQLWLTRLSTATQHREPEVPSQTHRSKKRKKNKRRAVRRFRLEHEELYTDKDRAAAVNMGSRDIKQSLKQKRREERGLGNEEASALTEEATADALVAVGKHEMKTGNPRVAVTFIDKALELNPDEKNGLVARSRCHLMLGQPRLALQDAEGALSLHKDYIKAVYQKAEALYHLGEFEHSLMYYHRGLRARPDLEGFRLGVQKTQEAIENTIGAVSKKKSLKLSKTETPLPCSTNYDLLPNTDSSFHQLDDLRHESPSVGTRPKTCRRPREPSAALNEDKDYLEKLLKDPALRRIPGVVSGCKTRPGDSDRLTGLAREAVAFLDGRQEFWRQQRPMATSAGVSRRPGSKSSNGDMRRPVSTAPSSSTRRTPA